MEAYPQEKACCDGTGGGEPAPVGGAARFEASVLRFGWVKRRKRRGRRCLDAGGRKNRKIGLLHRQNVVALVFVLNRVHGDFIGDFELREDLLAPGAAGDMFLPRNHFVWR